MRRFRPLSHLSASVSRWWTHCQGADYGPAPRTTQAPSPLLAPPRSRGLRFLALHLLEDRPAPLLRGLLSAFLLLGIVLVLCVSGSPLLTLGGVRATIRAQSEDRKNWWCEAPSMFRWRRLVALIAVVGDGAMGVGDSSFADGAGTALEVTEIGRRFVVRASPMAPAGPRGPPDRWGTSGPQEPSGAAPKSALLVRWSSDPVVEPGSKS